MNEEKEIFSEDADIPKKTMTDIHPLPPISQNSSEKKESWLDILKFALVTAAIVLPIRFFIAQPFLVSGPSMEPLFNDKDYLIVDEISYRFEAPKRGEVIVFRRPEENKYLIKRIIALPRETIILEGDKIEIKNGKHPEGFNLEENYITSKTVESPKTITLDENQYYVLGDNRPVSYDSRYWGPLESKNIVGRPLFRLYPFSQIGLFPGRQND